MLSPKSSTELQAILSEVKKAISAGGDWPYVRFGNGTVVIDNRGVRFVVRNGMALHSWDGTGCIFEISREKVDAAIADGTLKELIETEQAIAMLKG